MLGWVRLIGRFLMSNQDAGLRSLRPCWTIVLSILQECYLVGLHGQTLEVLACHNSCSARS
jgi:hypothetical protein